MIIKHSTIFLIDREGDKPDGKLRYRIKWNDNKFIVAFNVGYRVEFDKWSKDTQRCKNNTTHGSKKVMASVINRAIQKYENAGEQTFIDFEKKGVMPTKEEFRDAFNIAIGKQTATPNEVAGFFEIFDKFVSDVGKTNNWTDSTYEKFSSLRTRLKVFNADVSFATFNEQGLTDYVIFLRDVKDMRNSTIAKQLDFLKWFLRWATNKGYNSETAYLTYSPKLKSTEKKIIFLDWEELMQVYNFEFPTDKSYLARVRDVFCFCCFTSLRYSDVANLRRSDVKPTYIEITTVKTADSLKIELNDFSRTILEKYENVSFDKDLALPVISNQRMNDYIKEMGQMCGIDTPIRETYYKGNKRIDEVYPKYALLSTHAGRRTFICNALALGVPAQVVMKWTGHSDYKAMKPYIAVADKVKEEAMNLFNKKSPM